MFTNLRTNRPAAALSVSFALALGALAIAPLSQAHAETIPKFSLHVGAPHVTTSTTLTVAPGMSESDVRALLGEPQGVARFTRSRTVAWDYDFRDDWGYDATFSVIFDEAGSVVGKVSVRRDA
ncbi:MAG TPA: outer membrane protein assembly factor BamE [Usitatibacter sp.]|nr:outer membrane protein assembly factor BamE [Usitatibacter sp.]